ncbi:MAG: Type secretion system-associated domain protein TagH [Pseudomonadota bacterium]|nr:Type secretion system-associated domain protein TagH [Pseudomonadota bacterium]
MPLKLTITSYQRLSPGQEPAKTLERGSLKIGRASKNDWILQDPERILSSEHCVVHCKDGGYVLTDTSTNGTFLNDSEQRIPRNQAVQLKSGDHFVLGEYEIAVAIVDAEAESEDEEAEGPLTDIAFAPGLTPQPPAIPANASPQFGASSDILKPSFSDLLTDRHDDQDHLGLGQSMAGLPTPGAATEPPSDLGGPEGAVYEPPDLSTPEPLLEPTPRLQELIPEPFDLPVPPLPPEPIDRPLPEPAASTAEGGTLIPDDWWQAPASVAAPPVTPVSAPPLTPPFVEPTPKPLIAPAVAEPVGPDTHELLQAFLKGAGLPPLHLTDDQWLATMSSLGTIFRETVRGLMDILLARGDIKGEFRLDRTNIGPVENNPLKTPPGQPPLRVEEVMALLLIEQKSTYMSPVQAVREGFDDIKAHQLAVMAGIQAALSRLISRFDPDHLQTRLEQSVLDNIWPSNRKAKYWDLFNAEYQAIAREAEDDFNELFGDEFARAYEERLRSR